MFQSKKRVRVFFLVIVLLCGLVSIAVADSYNPWPTREKSGVGVGLAPVMNNKNGKRQAYYGPNSRQYAKAGAYKAASVTNALALFREGDYALVDLYYPATGKACVYFPVKELTNRNIPEEYLTSYSAKTTSEVEVMEGPGYDYHAVDYPYLSNTKQVRLARGTWINVFFEIDGWVFAEFSCEAGMIRAWIPANQVEAI